MMFGLLKGRLFSNIITSQCHLGQSDNWTVCVMLETCTCSLWWNMLFLHLLEHRASFQAFCRCICFLIADCHCGVYLQVNKLKLDSNHQSVEICMYKNSLGKKVFLQGWWRHSARARLTSIFWWSSGVLPTTAHTMVMECWHNVPKFTESDVNYWVQILNYKKEQPESAT